MDSPEAQQSARLDFRLLNNRNAANQQGKDGDSEGTTGSAPCCQS